MALKDALKAWLITKGEACIDFGTYATESVDYPDFAALVGRAVASGEVDCGILVCGSGVGMAIAANKIDGIRAAVATETESARLSRSHNNANVLALGARLTQEAQAKDIVSIFLETPYEGGRHQRRVDKISALESPA